MKYFSTVLSAFIRENLRLYSFFAISFRLNILSMRSVMTNPPTTFVVAQTTAIKPSIVLTLLYCAPAVTMEPTSEIPEIAFVADINGV
jgi:hypothetical protein